MIPKTNDILNELSVSVNDISRAVIDLQSCFSALRTELSKPTPKVVKKTKPRKAPEPKMPPKAEVPEKISLKGKVSYKDKVLSIEQIPKTNDVGIAYLNAPKRGIIMNKSTLLAMFNKMPSKFTPDDIKNYIARSPKIRINNNNLKTPYLIMWFYILIFHKNCKKISGKRINFESRSFRRIKKNVTHHSIYHAKLPELRKSEITSYSKTYTISSARYGRP